MLLVSSHGDSTPEHSPTPPSHQQSVADRIMLYVAPTTAEILAPRFLNNTLNVTKFSFRADRCGTPLRYVAKDPHMPDGLLTLLICAIVANSYDLRIFGRCPRRNNFKHDTNKTTRY